MAGNGVECCLTLYLFCGGRVRCLGWEWRGVLPDFVSVFVEGGWDALAGNGVECCLTLYLFLWREGEMPWLGMAWSVA